jgi:hypothetical protein
MVTLCCLVDLAIMVFSIPGKNFVEHLHGTCSDACQDIGEPSFGVDVVQDSGMDHRFISCKQRRRRATDVINFARELVIARFLQLPFGLAALASLKQAGLERGIPFSSSTGMNFRRSSPMGMFSKRQSEL